MNDFVDRYTRLRMGLLPFGIGLFLQMLVIQPCGAEQPKPAVKEAKQLPIIRDERRNFTLRVRDAKTIRTENLILQERDFSCGAAALATVVKYFWGDDVTETQVLAAIIATLTKEELDERIKNGLTLTDLKRLAERAGYATVVGKLTIDKLGESKVPLLVGITVNNFDHFVVVRGVDDQYVYLADPAIGRTRTPKKVFEKQWQQNIVLAVIRRGASLPKDSSLLVSEEERRLGESNTRFLQNHVVGFP